MSYDDMTHLDMVIQEANRQRRAQEAMAFAQSQQALAQAQQGPAQTGGGVGGAGAGAGTLAGAIATKKILGAFGAGNGIADSAAANTAWNAAATNAGGLTAATPTATAASQAVPGASFGSVAGPLAFVATAPIWAPKVAKIGGKFFEGVFGGDANRKYDSKQILDLQKNDPRRQKVWEGQVPGWSGMDDKTKTALLDKTHDLGILNLAGKENKPATESISLNLLAKRMGLGGNSDKNNGVFGEKYNFRNLDPLIQDIEKRKFHDEDPNSRRALTADFLRYVQSQKQNQFNPTSYLADLMTGGGDVPT